MATIKVKSHKIRYIFVIVALSICICVGLVLSALQGQYVNKQERESDYRHITYKGKSYKYNTSIVSILLLGIDKTKNNPEQGKELGQSDAISLLVFDRTNKVIKLISIPRDTITEIEKTDFSGETLGWQKDHINLAYAYGSSEKSGCMKSMRAVSRMMMNIPISRYGSMGLDNIQALQEIVGNLKVKVPSDSLKKVTGWKKGDIVTITKDNVETFVRIRDIDKDYSAQDRLERQQAYYEAYFDKLKTMLDEDFNETVSKLYDFSQNVVTNVSYQDIVTFANMMLDYKYSSDQLYVLPGENGKDADYDAYYLDQPSLKQMIIKIFYQS